VYKLLSMGRVNTNNSVVALFVEFSPRVMLNKGEMMAMEGVVEAMDLGVADLGVGLRTGVGAGDRHSA